MLIAPALSDGLSSPAARPPANSQCSAKPSDDDPTETTRRSSRTTATKNGVKGSVQCDGNVGLH